MTPRTKLQNLLRRENASARLRTVMWMYGRSGRPLTVGQLVRDWPRSRLVKEVFGFGIQAQRELSGILSRHPLTSVYGATLLPPPPSRQDAIQIGKFRIWHLESGKLWLEIIGAEGMATAEAKLEAHLEKYFTREF